MFRTIMAALVLLVVASCDTVKETPTAKAETPKQHLLALNVQYNGIFSLMNDYQNLKRCNVAATKICSEQKVVNQMRAINTSFDASLETAWKIVDKAGVSESSAEAAVETVRVIVADARKLYDSVKDVISAFKASEGST